ncbi:MAG: hypothetical protein VW397_02405 [Candidatus Margulisiibacteriota bacterium]
MSIAVVNGKLINSENKVNVQNLMIQNGKVTGVGYIPDEDESTISIFDITQSLILPNTFDFFYAPDIRDLNSYIDEIQGSGIFNFALLPNQMTNVLDHPMAIEKFLSMKPQTGTFQLFASATKDGAPDSLSELSLLCQAGASGIYLGRIIENEILLKQALTYIDMIGCPIVVGPLTRLITGDTHLNEGDMSFKIGIRGESIDDEFRRVQDFLSIVERYTRVPIHFLSISSPKAVNHIHEFKNTYHDISVGLSPFHLILSDNLLSDYNNKLKFNPPLRSESEMNSLHLAFTNGQFDMFTSLHAPSDKEMQPRPFFNTMPYVQTLNDFFSVASHLLSESDFDLEQMASFFEAPISFRNYKKNQLGLNDPASFIALKNHSRDPYEVDLSLGVTTKLSGGVDLLVHEGVVK